MSTNICEDETSNDFGITEKLKSTGKHPFIFFCPSTVNFLKFWTPKNFAVIYLKFKQRGQTIGYFVKMMQME